GRFDVMHGLRAVADHRGFAAAHRAEHALFEPAAPPVHEGGVDAHRAEPSLPVPLQNGVGVPMPDAKATAVRDLRGLADPAVGIRLIEERAEGMDEELPL